MSYDDKDNFTEDDNNTTLLPKLVFNPGVNGGWLVGRTLDLLKTVCIGSDYVE